MNKFPVIKNGIEYEVKIVEHGGYKYIWIAYLYIYKNRKLLKGKKKCKVYSKYFGIKEHKYIFEDVEYLGEVNFIEISSKVIEGYEINVLSKINDISSNSNKLKKAISDFESWDGTVE